VFKIYAFEIIHQECRRFTFRDKIGELLAMALANSIEGPEEANDQEEIHPQDAEDESVATLPSAAHTFLDLVDNLGDYSQQHYSQHSLQGRHGDL
jgi:hypothetical protein